MTWFGLTQRQEAQAGFDACTALNGRIFFFQFKASNHVTAKGFRQFRALHNQMIALKRLSRGIQGVVFYVFPLVGNTDEIALDPDVLRVTWLLDVAKIPALAPPVTRTGSPRRSGLHYVNVFPPLAGIHSESTDVELIQGTQLASTLSDSKGISSERLPGPEEFSAIQPQLGRKAYMVLLH